MAYWELSPSFIKSTGAGLTLDLTSINNTRIQDIEIIDIRGSGDNTLKLNLNDLLDASTSTNIPCTV
jgi:hypothetical protein